MNYGIDMGHPLKGPGSGAVGIVSETVINRQIGNLVISGLKALGHTVVNCTCNSATSSNDSLGQVIANANNGGVQEFISIHLNDDGAGGKGGVEVLINHWGDRSEQLARKVQAAMAALGYSDRGVRCAKEYLGYNLAVLHQTKMPAILVECGFVDVQADCDRFNAQKVANAIILGITGQQTSTLTPSKPIANTNTKAITQGIVTASVLNVRTGPGTTFNVVGKLLNGQVVRVGRTENGWSNIYYEKISGWASQQYIKQI